MRGEYELERHGAAAVLAVLLAGDRERADIGETAGVEVGDRGGEHVVAVELEQLDRARDAEPQA